MIFFSGLVVFLLCIAINFDCIFCNGTTYCCVLQLEMHARLTRAIKFYLLTYLHELNSTQLHDTFIGHDYASS